METGRKHMAPTNSSFNKLTDLDLSIQLSLSGLSFCIKKLNTIVYLKEVIFDKQLNPLAVLNELKDLFRTETALNNTFSNVVIIHDNELATLVPSALFDKNYLTDYLKFNSKILKSDFIAYDAITENNSVNVYVPYVNINNFIYDKFGAFTYKHVSTVLIASILKIEVNCNETKVYINVSSKHFEIVVLDKNKLLLANYFKYSTKEDFIYYTLFTIEQLKLNTETLSLRFLGAITLDDPIYKIAYKYIRNVGFGKRNDGFKYLEQPETDYCNFTLLKSF